MAQAGGRKRKNTFGEPVRQLNVIDEQVQFGAHKFRFPRSKMLESVRAVAIEHKVFSQRNVAGEVNTFNDTARARSASIIHNSTRPPVIVVQHTGGIRAEIGMLRAERDRDDVAGGTEPTGGAAAQAQAQAQAGAQGQG